MNNKQKKTRGNSNKEVDSTIQVMRKMDSSLQSVSTRPRKPSTSASGSTDAGPSSSSSSNIVSRSNSNQKLQDQEPKTPPPSRRLNFDSDDGDEKPISDHDLNYRDDQRLFRMTPHPTDKTKSSMSWDEHSLRLPPPNNSQMRPPSKFLLTAVDGPPSDDDEADYQKSIMDMEMLPLTMPGGRRPFLSDSHENFAPPYNAPSLPRTARVPSATSSNNSNLGDADDESSSNSDVPEQRKKRAATLTTGTGQQQVMEVIGQLEKVLINGNIVWRADA